jgi:hypothetical protein
MSTVRDWFTGRWLSGGLALLGVLLVVPSLLSPTWVMSVSDREHGSVLSRQWEWSWGRVRQTGLEGVELRDEWNPVGLAVIVVLLVAALAGVAVWAARRGAWGRVAGLVAVGLLAGRVLTTVSDRVGRSIDEMDQGASGLSVRTGMTSAGSLETAAAVVLVVAVATMVFAALRDERTGGAGDPEPSGHGTREARVGRAAPADETVGLRPPGEHLSGPAVDLVEEERG